MRKDLYIHSNGFFFQSFLFVLSNREPTHFHLYLPTFLDNDTDKISQMRVKRALCWPRQLFGTQTGQCSK